MSCCNGNRGAPTAPPYARRGASDTKLKRFAQLHLATQLTQNGKFCTIKGMESGRTDVISWLQQ